MRGGTGIQRDWSKIFVGQYLLCFFVFCYYLPTDIFFFFKTALKYQLSFHFWLWKKASMTAWISKLVRVTVWKEIWVEENGKKVLFQKLDHISYALF